MSVYEIVHIKVLARPYCKGERGALGIQRPLKFEIVILFDSEISL
jgi:hypothetical protein